VRVVDGGVHRAVAVELELEQHAIELRPVQRHRRRRVHHVVRVDRHHLAARPRLLIVEQVRDRADRERTAGVDAHLGGDPDRIGPRPAAEAVLMRERRPSERVQRHVQALRPRDRVRGVERDAPVEYGRCFESGRGALEPIVRDELDVRGERRRRHPQ
jgi:hypothetical protein